ncbi:MAG: zf-HC2 domain-containing protein [Planctomycetota bacterium]|nr:zf-HC2 domain-containing protein [Planctomycetota bacterium]
MNCEQTRQHWHLFHDSEGDAELHQRINEHLSMCPECARWFFQQSQLEEAVTETLRQGERTADMWDRISRRAVSTEPTAARSRYLLGGILVLAASMLIVVSLVFWNAADGSSRDLTTLSVGLHEKLATGREDVKFSSGSHIEIEEYLRRQVTFPVRCPPREDAGFHAAGGGVCKFDQAPVAYVVGQVGGQRVSVFIMSRESLSRFPEQQAALQRRQIVSQQRGDCEVVMGEVNENLVLVVGRVTTDQLDRVLKAYGSYHEHGPQVPPTHRASDPA